MIDFTIAAPETRLQNFLERVGLRGFPWITAIVLYTISWGWLFIVRDSLWAHDWDSFAIPEFADFIVDDYGFAPWTKYETTLFQVAGPAVFRFITFFCFFLSAVLLFGILKKTSLLTLIEQKFFILFVLILPINTARIALMVFKNSTAYFLFFLAWFLLVTFRGTACKLTSLIIFFLSFQMHSLLFFYFFPFLHILVLSKVRNFRELALAVKNNLLFITLPFVYWVCRNSFWPERSPYHNLSFSSIYESISFIVVSGIFFLFFLFLKTKLKPDFTKALNIILFGVSSFFLGLLPYVLYRYFAKTQLFFPISYLTTALGRSNWNSRHLILQPIGISLFMIGFAKLFFYRNNQIRKSLFTLGLTFCTLINLGFGFEFVVDNIKQEKVVETLKTRGDNLDSSVIQFVDQTTLLNARGQKMYPNSWSGLIWKAYGLDSARRIEIQISCVAAINSRLVLIQGPKTHWQALKNWVGNGDMGFEVTVDDSPGACKPEMVTSEKVSGAIPILFYFTGARN